MEKLRECQKWLAANTDLFLDLVRVYLGVGLAVKAVYLMSNTNYLMSLIERSGSWWFAPAAAAHYVVMAHLVGGILLALGLVTRLAALAQVPVLVGAVFYVYMPEVMTWEPRQNLEFTGLVLFLLALYSVFGAGRWSLDYYFAKKFEESEAHAGHATPHAA
ncbi:MAG: DoxX family protein [Verrucomicrobia bacterium]|nr:DoxX family protein [Verrucomicrobiota bacterium]